MYYNYWFFVEDKDRGIFLCYIVLEFDFSVVYFIESKYGLSIFVISMY